MYMSIVASPTYVVGCWSPAFVKSIELNRMKDSLSERGLSCSQVLFVTSGRFWGVNDGKMVRKRELVSSGLRIVMFNLRRCKKKKSRDLFPTSYGDYSAPSSSCLPAFGCILVPSIYSLRRHSVSRIHDHLKN